MMRLENVKFSVGGQQALSIVTIDFVSKQVARECVFLNGVLAFAADQQAIFGIVLEQTICARLEGRHDR